MPSEVERYDPEHEWDENVEATDSVAEWGLEKRITALEMGTDAALICLADGRPDDAADCLKHVRHIAR